MTYSTFKIDMLKAEVLVLFDAYPKAADEKGAAFVGQPKAQEILDWDGFCYRRGRKIALWFHPSAQRSVVFHECFHATVGLLEEIGANGKDEELNAHLCEMVTEKTLSLWEKQKGK